MINCTHKDCGFRAFTNSELKRHVAQRHSGVNSSAVSSAPWELNTTYEPATWTISEDANKGWSVDPTPPSPDTYSGGGGSFGGGGASGGWDDNGFSGGSNGDN